MDLWHQLGMIARAPSCTHCARDRGVALFAAVWIVLVVTVLAIGVTREARTTARITGNVLAEARARAAAEAGLVWLSTAIAAQGRGEPLIQGPIEGDAAAVRRIDTRGGIHLDGRPALWRFDDADVTLSAQMLTGLVDLNRAPVEVIAGVLDAHVPNAAERIAVAIELARTSEGRISWRMSDKPISSVGALGNLDAVTPEIYRRIAPLLTVNGRDTVNPLYAPEALYQALPLAPDIRTDHGRLRRMLPVDHPFPVTGGPVRLTAEARLADGTRVRLNSVVRIDPTAAQPVRVIRHPVEEP